VNYEIRHTSLIRIVDAAHYNTALYTPKFQLGKINPTINNAPTTTTIDTVTFHALITRIDTEVHGSPIALTAHGILKPSYTWSSTALGGGAMRWKGGESSSELVCLDKG